MPPKLERLFGKKKKETVEIARFPLLETLFANQEDVDKEYEVERRFKPGRILSVKELNALSEGKSRFIAQVYVFALDKRGNKSTVRLRRTWPEPEGKLLRIAHKTKIKGDAGRMECQIRFPESDPRAREFEKLWEAHRWNSIQKKRFYIEHALPNGKKCEIHYDIHSGGNLDGFVRIEVEFQNQDDALYAEKSHGRFPVLPDWIGEDVTDDERYGSKALAKEGIPRGVQNPGM